MLKGIYPSVCGRLPNILDAYRTLTTEEERVQAGASRFVMVKKMKWKAFLVMVVLMMFSSQRVLAQAPQPEQNAVSKKPISKALNLYEPLTWYWTDYTAVSLSWVPNLNATVYDVYLAEGSEDFQLAGSSTNFSFPVFIDCEETKFAYIIASDGINESWPSNIVVLNGMPCLDEVYGMYATVSSPPWPSDHRDVTLYWQPNQNSGGHNVYSWKSGDRQITKVAEFAWDWIQESVPCGTQVVYWVTTVAGSYESGFSDPILVTVDCNQPIAVPIPEWLPGRDKLVSAKKVFVPLVASP